MPIDMFPRTIENRLKMGRYVPILRHQSARIDPCGDGSIDVTNHPISSEKVPYFRAFPAFDYQRTTADTASKLTPWEYINANIR